MANTNSSRNIVYIIIYVCMYSIAPPNNHPFSFANISFNKHLALAKITQPSNMFLLLKHFSVSFQRLVTHFFFKNAETFLSFCSHLKRIWSRFQKERGNSKLKRLYFWISFIFKVLEVFGKSKAGMLILFNIFKGPFSFPSCIWKRNMYVHISFGKHYLNKKAYMERRAQTCLQNPLITDRLGPNRISLRSIPESCYRSIKII